MVSGRLMPCQNPKSGEAFISIRVMKRQQLLLLRATAPQGDVPCNTHSSPYFLAMSKLMFGTIEKKSFPSPYMADFKVSRCSEISCRFSISLPFTLALTLISNKGSENLERALPYPRGAMYLPKS